MRETATSMMLWVLLLGVAGCLESNPQPSPEQTGDKGPNAEREVPVDEDRIYLSAPDEAGASIVVGESGAAAEADEVYADGMNGEAAEPTAGGDVDEDGSFVLVVPDIAPPTVTLTFRFPDGDVDVILKVPQPAADDDELPWVSRGDEAAEEPGATPPPNYDDFDSGGGLAVITAVALDGMITVSGGFLSVAPFARVVVVNLSSNDEAVTNANNSGAFITELPGEVGDGIGIFAVNPDNNEKATAPLFLTAE